MKSKAGLLVAVIVVVAVVLAGYLLRRSPVPAAVSGAEAPKPAVDAGAAVRTLMARIKEQSRPAVSTPDPNKAAPVVTEPVPDEQEELRAVETYAATERQKIETWYSGELATLKAELDQRIARLEGIDKMAWTQFRQQVDEAWSTTSGRSGTTTTSLAGDPTGEYAAVMAQIKDSRRATRGDFTKAQEWLACMREDKLAAVQREVDRRKVMIALQKSRARTETARKQAGDPTPRVEAVTGGAGDPFLALIGEGLVSEGDTVQGYRVKKIQADSVEFEKDGEVWIQKVD
jgi:hypothetical protein